MDSKFWIITLSLSKLSFKIKKVIDEFQTRTTMIFFFIFLIFCLIKCLILIKVPLLPMGDIL